METMSNESDSVVRRLQDQCLSPCVNRMSVSSYTSLGSIKANFSTNHLQSHAVVQYSPVIPHRTGSIPEAMEVLKERMISELATGPLEPQISLGHKIKHP